MEQMENVLPCCFGFTGTKGFCGGSSHGFWENLNNFFVRGSEIKQREKYVELQCISITKYHQ